MRRCVIIQLAATGGTGGTGGLLLLLMMMMMLMLMLLLWRKGGQVNQTDATQVEALHSAPTDRSSTPGCRVFRTGPFCSTSGPSNTTTAAAAAASTGTSNTYIEGGRRGRCKCMGRRRMLAHAKRMGAQRSSCGRPRGGAHR